MGEATVAEVLCEGLRWTLLSLFGAMHDHFKHAAEDLRANQLVEAGSSGATDMVCFIIFLQSADIRYLGLFNTAQYPRLLRLLVALEVQQNCLLFLGVENITCRTTILTIEVDHTNPSCCNYGPQSELEKNRVN